MVENIDTGKHDHRWGFKDSGFELRGEYIYFKGRRYPYLKNQRLPHFREFVEKTLGFTLSKSDFNPPQPIKLPLSRFKKNLLSIIHKSFGEEQFSVEKRDRISHSHGQTTTEEVYKVLYSKGVPRYADAVFYPEQEEDLIKLISLANKHNFVLVPYGGGTSVSSALLLPPKERRAIVVVDMRKLDKIISIDKANGLALIEAGIVGRHLEERLNAEGYTMGHEPDSIEFSTLGGWISTNASGMKRSRYGNIEDIVINYTLITPTGKVEELSPYKKDVISTSKAKKKTGKIVTEKVSSAELAGFDRVSAGMQLKKLIFGSEGNLGFISKVLVKIHRLPEEKRYDSLLFPNFVQGLAFLRALSEQNFKPASIRLVDNRQFQFGYALRLPKPFYKELIDKFKKFLLLKVKKFNPEEMCLATVLFEGSKSDVDYQNRSIKKLAQTFGGVGAGSENGRRGYTLTMVIAYIRDFISDYHGIGETLETTVPWDRVVPLCRALDEEMALCHSAYKLPGKFFVTSRITQLYHGGVCVYVTLALYLKGVKQPEDVFAKIEKRIRARVLSEGGSVSHHHGIGKLRKEFHGKFLSPAHIAILKEIKKTADPKNIFAIANNIFGE